MLIIFIQYCISTRDILSADTVYLTDGVYTLSQKANGSGDHMYVTSDTDSVIHLF